MKKAIPEKLKDTERHVAVMFSPGFGAGWSSWAGDDELAEFLLFDKTLITMADRHATTDEVEEYLESKGYEQAYLGGWNQVSVMWLRENTPFTVTEYDGSESIITQVEMPYIA